MLKERDDKISELLSNPAIGIYSHLINPDDVHIFTNNDYYKNDAPTMLADKRVKHIYGVNEKYDKFCIGDRIQVKDWGGYFSSYTAMAKAMGLPNWCSGGMSPNFYEGTIVAIKIHEDQQDIVLGVYFSEIGGEILISHDFVKLAPEFFDDDDMEI
jgi:hypothetical protein